MAEEKSFQLEHSGGWGWAVLQLLALHGHEGQSCEAEDGGWSQGSPVF